jgi:hypothetical protein
VRVVLVACARLRAHSQDGNLARFLPVGEVAVRDGLDGARELEESTAHVGVVQMYAEGPDEGPVGKLGYEPGGYVSCVVWFFGNTMDLPCSVLGVGVSGVDVIHVFLLLSELGRCCEAEAVHVGVSVDE